MPAFFPRIAACLITGAWILAGCGASSPQTDTTGGPAVSSAGSGGGNGTTGTTGGTAGNTVGGTSGSTTGPLAPTNVTAQTLGLLVNPEDPQSVAVASAYQTLRGIPAENVFALPFARDGGGGRDTLDALTFDQLKQALDGDAGSKIQAYAISWTFPFAVEDSSGCIMSITSAFGLGFNEKWCIKADAGTCGITATDPYYKSKSISPYTDLGIRPTMMLAGADAGAAIAVIERGAASDATYPKGNADLVITTDSVRSVRYMEFDALAKSWDGGDGVFVDVIDNSASTVDQGALLDAGSVLFYLTGLATVSGLETNQYLNGAVGDSLTSFGGYLSGAGQTTCLDWLYAGLTGSMGTVREPCNYTTKFSDPTILVPDYTSGATLVEAYWKSVAWPGEGLFTGDPLARPWGG